MNNRYFGNIHDFCKYGLLRQLARSFRLGVCWMLTPFVGKSDFGYDYLVSGSPFGRHDRELFNWLLKKRRESNEGEWGVGMIEKCGMIPRADYFGERMPETFAGRGEYFDKMLRKFDNRDNRKDIVFLDPDFGLGFTAREFTGNRGGGYLHPGEVARCIDAGFSVLFYQDWRYQFPHPIPGRAHGEIDPATKIRNALRREGVQSPVLGLEMNADLGRKMETGGTLARFFLVQHPEKHGSNIAEFVKEFRHSSWCRDKIFVARHRVGVFIDAENSGDARKISHVLDNIQRIVPLGESVYARLFGKPRIGQGTDQIGKEKRELQGKHPFMEFPCEVGKGKDEAEVAMAVDIHNKILQGEVDAVVVFAKDHLNRPIARIAKEAGVPYYGIGIGKDTTPEYRLECTKFFTIHARDGGGYCLKESSSDSDREEIANRKPKKRKNPRKRKGRKQAR